MTQVAGKEAEPLLLSVKRTAKVMGLSEWQVRHLLAEEQLPHTLVGKRIYIPAASVREYVENARRSA